MGKNEKSFLERHRTFILYLIFGFSATILETYLYWLFFRMIEMQNLQATLLAWIITIIYAFFTNKIFVYKSKDCHVTRVFREFLSFFGFRAGTGLFNIAFMFVTVDLLSWWPVTMKMIAALIVGLMNYFAGKSVVFRKGAESYDVQKDAS